MPPAWECVEHVWLVEAAVMDASGVVVEYRCDRCGAAGAAFEDDLRGVSAADAYQLRGDR